MVQGHVQLKGTRTIRRMIAAMIAPAAALEIGPLTEYEIRDVSLISSGESTSFWRVETYVRGLTIDQANELCQDLGFSEAIGVDRERYDGGRYDVVTCRDDEPYLPD